MLSNLLEYFGGFSLPLLIDHSLATYVFAGVCTLLLLWYRSGKRKGGRSIPGPLGLPYLGYLPFLGSEPHKTLHKLGKKYGDVFRLQFGRSSVVVLTSFEAVREAFSQEVNDRPEKTFDYFPGGVGLSGINGQEWYEQRKYCMKALKDLGLGKSSWGSLVQDEVEEVVRAVAKQGGRPFNITKLLTASMANNISSLLFGRRRALDLRHAHFLSECVTGAGQFAAQVGLRNAYPALVDWMSGLGLSEFGKNRKHLVDLTDYIRNQLEDHKNTIEEEKTNNFIEDYLDKVKENKRTFTEANLIGNLNALFFASIETTRSSVTWLLLFVAAFPDVQSRVQAEVDDVLRGRTVRWEDRTTLPYTYAVVMEGQRWKTVAPLNTPRRATEDIRVGKYDIEKGTTIIANLWSLHNDERYWEEPDKFNPERFLTDDGKSVNLKPDSYAPFSYGKRNCPGDFVGMMEVLFYFVALLQRFRVLPPKGKSVKLQGTLGMTYQPVPQELRFINRFS